jgi:hypothetical protein
VAKKIGDVYVQVHFNSNGRELRDKIKEDPNYAKAGEEAAKQEGEGYNDEWTHQLDKRLKEDDNYNKRRSAAFKGSLTKIEKDLDRFWANEKKNMREGVDRPLGDITNDIENLGKKWRGIWERRVDIGVNMHDAEDVDRRLDELSDRLRNAAGWSAGLANEFEDTVRALERGGKKAETDRERLHPVRHQVRHVRDEGRQGVRQGKPERLHQPVRRHDGGLTNVVGLLPKFIGLLGQAGTAFNVAKDAAADLGKNGFRQITSGLNAALSELSISPFALIGIAAAIGGIGLALGPIAALISGIAAAITAFVSSLSFAVIGVLAPLVGLIAPVAIAVGTVGAAFATLDKKAKKELFTRIRKGFADLGSAARSGFGEGFQGGVGKVTQSLHVLEPLLHATGRALGQLTSKFLDGFKSPSFNKFVRQMTVFVPNALESLGTIAQNVAGAIGNIFIDLIPSTNDFLGWLTGITQEFQNWTGSETGRQTILTFLDHAKTSAKAVGGFLLEVTKFLGTLIGSGRTTGDSIFTDLTKQVETFRKFISPKVLAVPAPTFDERLGGPKHPKLQKPVLGPSPLEGFFKNGKETADQLGQIAVNLGKIFDELDNPNSQRALHIFMGFLEVASRPSGGAGLLLILNPLAGMLNLIGAISRLKPTKAIEGIVRGIHKIGSAKIPDPKINWGGALNKVRTFGGQVLGVIGRAGGSAGRSFYNAFIGPIVSANARVLHVFITGMGAVGRAVSAGASNAVRFFTGIPGRIGNISTQFGSLASQWSSAVMTELGKLPGQIVSLFSGLASRVVSAIGSINITPHINWPSPPGWLSKIVPGATAVGGIFDGAQLRIIGEAGPEAVVPLAGPLSRVDPAVRELAAFARGQQTTVSATGGGGKSITTGPITIVTPTKDPRAVARQVVNQLAVSSYFG